MRVGMGYDVHKLVEGRDLILGGVKIPYEKGLLGHSDADVLLHAIMDALLGAAALGDIGKHFPDTDPVYKGASSIRLLEEVGRMIDEKLYVIGNIDATIIAQRPKMAPHIEQMRKNVAEALHIEVDQVNIKATTEEGLGFTGTGEGISSQAIASLDTIANYSYRVGPAEGGCAGCGAANRAMPGVRRDRWLRPAAAIRSRCTAHTSSGIRASSFRPYRSAGRASRPGRSVRAPSGRRSRPVRRSVRSCAIPCCGRMRRGCRRNGRPSRVRK